MNKKTADTTIPTPLSPELVAQWHPTKNGELKPHMVKPGSGKKIWWLCSTCGHEWEAAPNNRSRGAGCPVCARQKMIPGVNDLATMNPELAAQWHPTKNGALIPQNIAGKSTKKVWWLGPCGHEWETQVQSRSSYKSGCPVCAGRIVLPGFNDLATTRPELAAQWHPTKNGDLTAQMFTAGTSKKVWWSCANGHEWQADILSRSSGSGCPYCTGVSVIPHETDLATVNPELAAQWHPTKNGDLTPDMVKPQSNKKAWWLCPTCGREWEACISHRFHGNGCPTCSKQKVTPGVNDLATVNPGLAAQWHPTRNGALIPQNVAGKSTKKVWWLGPCGHEWQAIVNARATGTGCPICANHRKKNRGRGKDLATGNPELAAQWHPTKNGGLTPCDVTIGSQKKVWWLGSCGHEWEAIIRSRSKIGTGCPVCKGRSVLPGFNDLATTRPELAAQWHPTKNGDLTAQMVTAGTNKKVWWRCDKGHEWDALIKARAAGNGCPHCVATGVIPRRTDLMTANPELAAQWHPTRNGDLKPDMETAGSTRKVWWLCSTCGREWETTINTRMRGRGCPSCARRKIKIGVNDLATMNPELAAQWHPTKNGTLSPHDVTTGTNKKVWWLGPCGHEWETTVNTRVQKKAGCPVCAGRLVLSGFNDLATTHPKLAAQWHPTKNETLAPHDVTFGSHKKVWWLCPACDHEWQSYIPNRTAGSGCPVCAAAKRRKTVDETE